MASWSRPIIKRPAAAPAPPGAHGPAGALRQRPSKHAASTIARRRAAAPGPARPRPPGPQRRLGMDPTPHSLLRRPRHGAVGYRYIRHWMLVLPIHVLRSIPRRPQSVLMTPSISSSVTSLGRKHGHGAWFKTSGLHIEMLSGLSTLMPSWPEMANLRLIVATSWDT